MKSVRYFDVIQDTRFSDKPQEDVKNWVKKITEDLAKLPIKVEADNMRTIQFTDSEPCTSYRQRIYITKTSEAKRNKLTWESIFEVINNTKSCVYCSF